MDKFRKWIHMDNDMDLTEKVYILTSVAPMKSIGMTRNVTPEPLNPEQSNEKPEKPD